MGVWRAFMKEEFKWRKHVCKRNVKGSPKTKHWSDDCPGFDQGEKADGQNKTMWPKGTGHSNAIRAAVQRSWRWCDIQQKKPILLWTKIGGRQSRDRLLDGLTVKIRNRWAENFPDENALPPTARVSAEARDENVWGTHDVWEFRR